MSAHVDLGVVLADLLLLRAFVVELVQELLVLLNGYHLVLLLLLLGQLFVE